jgi:putative radical SAM enzyme (TIGR03279 family)
VTARPCAAGLPVAAVSGAAARAGLRAGDCVLAIDGAPPIDVLDLQAAAADGAFELVVARDGEERTIEVRLRRAEGHGIELWNGIGDAVRPCACACRFCFVDQVPSGLRAPLRVKDDDYRLSFLEGNFVTLANLTAADRERIVALRLSPLYVSLHAWDDEARGRLMGPRARPTRARLVQLLGAGIEAHVQVVLCPGENDGQVLAETLARLGETRGVLDVGVVPVSLAREDDLRRVTLSDALRAVKTVEELQKGFVATLGRRFAHAADELYLLIGRPPPAGDAPEQYENGVGICAAFLAEANTAPVLPDGARVALLTGTLAAPVVEEACRTLAAAAAAAGRHASARPFVVGNESFGEHVTVTGLLGGGEVLRALGERPLAEGEWLLAPRTFLPEHLGRTLDDVTEAELRDACGGRFVAVGDLADGVAAAARGLR